MRELSERQHVHAKHVELTGQSLFAELSPGAESGVVNEKVDLESGFGQGVGDLSRPVRVRQIMVRGQRLDSVPVP